MTQICNQESDAAACSIDLASLLPGDFFKALADPTRLEILCRLATEREPQTVSEVAECCPQSLSVVSRHLASLRDAGIVHCTKVGREVRCEVAFGPVIQTLRDLADALEACCPPDSPPCCGPANPTPEGA